MDKSPDEDESRRTLICKNIPQRLAKRVLLKQHFEQFGTVINVLINVERGTASVEFETHEQASSARRLATTFQSETIAITWKRSGARTSKSPRSDTKPPNFRSGLARVGLFGKALSSATGKLLGASKSVSGDARQRVKRQPVSEGLYDDLPPPGDWNEEDISGEIERKPKWKPQIVKPSVSIFGENTSSQPSTSKAAGGAKLFGKPVQPKMEKSDPSTSAKLFEKSFQPSRAKALPSADMTLFGKPAFGKAEPPKNEGAVLFGKSVLAKAEPSSSTAGTVLFGKPVEEESSNESEVGTLLFGNPSHVAKEEVEEVEPKHPPRLFGTTRTRSVSPARASILSRLSPARVGPTRSDSPFREASPFRPRRSPSPAPRPGIPTIAAPTDESETEVEWIMPPSLSVLRQTPAMSCSERQAVLEKREKLMRQGMSKESDIAKARATKGCCPDMCPERERYIREERRRVHAYEMISGTESHPQIDHRLAVKEYSRSSADQEEPLPLELRPAHALARTMEYLCNNILDIGADGTWGDWYDFLWNRTRAIRKDITQQHLCSVVVAGLVEKCVRFHIYCGARLVEEGPMIFDTKINNENLTKCLQTLKEMYTDLQKRGVTCESEAEFRAYVVLMNLNEGDTQREVQQLRPEVRNSAEINFALSAYAALNDKNYVHFFKLVRRTTFLNACILHRYFNQMRYEALKIILRAYSAPKGPALITFDRLIEILHFEDANDGAAFLQHYGLNISPSSLTISRDSFIEPESPLVAKRAPKLVESKLTTKLGEAVYGRPLPPNLLPQPTSSFDARGYFIGIIKPPQSDLLSEPVEVAHTAAPVPSLPPISEIPNQVVKDVTKEIILQVTDAETLQIVQQSVGEEKQFTACMRQEAESIAHQVVEERLLVIGREVLEEAKKERYAKQKAEERIIKEKIASDFISELIEKVQAEESKKIAIETYKDIQKQLYEQQKARSANAVGNQLIHKHMVALLEEVASEVYQSDVIDRLRELAEAEELVRTVRCKRFYRKWRAVYRKRTHLRRSMITFPSAPPLLPLKRSSEYRVTVDTVNLGKRSRLSVGGAKAMKADLQLSVINRRIKLMLSNTPLQMRKVISPVLNQHDNDSDYMKLVLLLPPRDGSDVDGLLSDWLTSKLSVGSLPEESPTHAQLLSLYNISVEGSERKSHGHQFGVCVRKLDFSPDADSLTMESLSGANTVAFLLPFTEEPDSWAYWSGVSERLRDLLDAGPVCPSAPLLVISSLDLPKEAVQDRLGLYDWLDSGVLSHVKVDRLDSTMDYSNQLPDSVQWLVSHRPSSPDLVVTDVHCLMETYLTSNLYSRLYEDLYSRQQQDLIHQSPEDLVHFYNELISSLSDVVFDEQLCGQLSWPVFERRQGCILRRADGIEMLDGMKLPVFYHSQSDDWNAACRDVFSYLDLVRDRHMDSRHLWIDEFETNAVPVLYSRVRNLLAKTESVFRARCERRFHCPPSLQPMRYNMPWTDIIAACVEFTISALDPDNKITHYPLTDDSGTCSIPLPTGVDDKYSDTMVLALVRAGRRESDNDSSLIDLELSIHTEPLHKINSEVSDELNASKLFEQLLEAELQTDDYCDDLVKRSERTEPAMVEGDDSESLHELIKKEAEKSRKFEEYLMLASQDNS